MGTPRKKDTEGMNDPKHAIREVGMKMKDRSCTDGICCIIFSVFLAAMIAVCCYAMKVGDPRVLITPFDSDGNRCGYAAQDKSRKAAFPDARDFTEYKYKFFTGILDTATKGKAVVTSGTYEAVCVKECPTGVAKLALKCLTNNDVSSCPIVPIDTTPVGQLCLPALKSTSESIVKLYKAMGENENLTQYILQIAEAKVPLLIMAASVFITTILYIYLLRFIAKPVLYISMFAIFVFGVLGGAYVFMMKDKYTPEKGVVNNYQYCLIGSIIIWVITALYTFFVCCQWNNIALGAAILHCSSEYMSSNGRIVFLPIMTYVALLPVTAIWVVSTVYLMSIGTPSFVEGSFIAKITYESHINYIMWVYLFGFFWVIAFILAVEQFVIGATCCMWYYNRGGDDASTGGGVSISLALGWSVKYHLGSLAMGSFLIAVISMIRFVFEYLVKKYESLAGADNIAYKMATCCVRCVLWCLDSYVKFLNKNAYIQIALQAKNFCPSAWQAFYLMVRHAGRFNSSALIGIIMTSMGKGTLVAFNAWLTILLTQQMCPSVQQPWIPAIPIAILSYVVASLFLSIYDFSSLAILHCFILNEDQEGKIAPPEALQEFLEQDSANAEKSGKTNKKVEDDGVPALGGKKLSEKEADVVNNME